MLWYTLHTKPNAELLVATALRQHEHQVYLPEIDPPRPQQSGKRKPFFPCYLFIKVDIQTIDLSQIQRTPGLRRIVAFDNKPIPLPNSAIDLIRDGLSEIKMRECQPACLFKPGDTVQITDGPFQDMLAIFEGPTTPSQRVQVLLKILGGASRVQVSAASLKEVSPDGQAPVAPARKRPRRTRGKGRRIN